VPLVLHDVDDAEAFVARIVERSGLDLSYHDRLDLEQFLLVQCWELSLRYRPGVIRKGFGAYATTTLRKRVIDHQRSKFRTRWVSRKKVYGGFRKKVYERPRPQLIELDDSVVDRLDEVESTRAGDPEAGGDEDWRGLLNDRDRCRAADLELLGLGEVA
jgi:hypothetical protein